MAYQDLFPHRLKSTRKKNNLTQEQLAEKLSLNKQAISQYERGVRRPNKDIAIEIARVLKVDVDWLLANDPLKEFSTSVLKDIVKNNNSNNNLDDLPYYSIFTTDDNNSSEDINYNEFQNILYEGLNIINSLGYELPKDAGLIEDVYNRLYYQHIIDNKPETEIDILINIGNQINNLRQSIFTLFHNPKSTNEMSTSKYKVRKDIENLHYQPYLYYESLLNILEKSVFITGKNNLKIKELINEAPSIYSNQKFDEYYNEEFALSSDELNIIKEIIIPKDLNYDNIDSKLIEHLNKIDFNKRFLDKIT